ncbi:MAG TPA: cyclic-di-AMP receptor [Anaerolineales bacterium]|nr:cyclic-di-AMP receptor [Anaerolineales bacterium]
MEVNPQSNMVILLAVLQAQDADLVTSALRKFGVLAYELSSTGAFLGRKNVTLLLPVETNNVDLVLSELKRNCRQRIEYVSMPIEGQPLPIPSPIPITVGGATIFILEIEQYLEVLQ